MTSRSRQFCSFLDGTGTKKFGPGKKYQYWKIWSRKKVPVLVPENLVPEKVPVLVLEQICPSTGKFPGTPGLDGTSTHTGKNLSRKKVPVPVPEKIGPGKSTSTGTGKIWSRKKVPVTVPEKFVPGKKYLSQYREKLVPEKKYRSRYRKKFWVPSHSVTQLEVKQAQSRPGSGVGGSGWPSR